MYIDARHEKLQFGGSKKAVYIINGANENDIKKKIFDAIGPYVLRIEIIPENEKVIITYLEHLISPSFMDYRFQLKELIFRREET